MNRWLSVCSVAFLLVASTGCLHHNVRGGACKSCGPTACSSGGCGSSSGGCNDGDCGSGQCGSGQCGSGQCGGGGCQSCSGKSAGILSRLKGRAACGNCGAGGCRSGCQAGPLGWQQGGLGYSSHLNPGMLGHGAGQQLQQAPFQPGPPTAAVASPYYTVRGPRDFLVDNPPTIGR